MTVSPSSRRCTIGIVGVAAALSLAAMPSGIALADDKPPSGLACLARYYALTPVLEGGRWLGRLPDGELLAWEDGRSKSFDETLDHPDLSDTLSIPYRKGPIRPVTGETDDPGRIRLDALFRATYPTGGADLTRVAFLDRKLTIHKKVVSAFARVEARLREVMAKDPSLRPFLKDVGGTFNPRNIAGTSRPSSHSYGVSLDINTKLSDYWRWQRPAAPLTWRNRVPQAIVDAFEAEGFVWGGRWYHYDTMHFEYRPELLDDSCGG